VDAPTETTSKTRWRPHWIAILLTLPVAWIVIIPQWGPRNRGWPFIYSANPFDYFNIAALIINIFVVCILIGGTLLFIDRWCKTQHRNISVLSLLGLLTIVGIIFAFRHFESDLSAPPRIDPVISPEERQFWSDAGLVYYPLRTSPWPIVAATYFAIGGALFTIGSFIVRRVSRSARLQHQPENAT
jgi:hypothetical protein